MRSDHWQVKPVVQMQLETEFVLQAVRSCSELLQRKADFAGQQGRGPPRRVQPPHAQAFGCEVPVQGLLALALARLRLAQLLTNMSTKGEQTN